MRCGTILPRRGMLRWFDPEVLPLLLEALSYLFRTALDLALYFGRSIAHLPQGAPHGTRNTRYALAPEEDQSKKQDDDQFATADIEDERDHVRALLRVRRVRR